MTNSVSKKRLALFASGRGSNGEALYKAMQEGLINGEFVVIITDHADAGIVERSKGWGIPLIAIERSQFDSKQAFEQAQLDALKPYCVDGIVLAGYMRIVGAGLIARYEHKILNIHPASCNASARPATRGASGPTTTRSTLLSFKKRIR